MVFGGDGVSNLESPDSGQTAATSPWLNELLASFRIPNPGDRTGLHPVSIDGTNPVTLSNADYKFLTHPVGTPHTAMRVDGLSNQSNSAYFSLAATVKRAQYKTDKV